METLIASQDELGDDKPDGNFFARNLPRDLWDAPWMSQVETCGTRPSPPRSHGASWFHAI